MGDAHPSICPDESLAIKDGLWMLAVGHDAQLLRRTKLLGLPGAGHYGPPSASALDPAQ